MTLSAGSRLGPYEVYRAQDTRLGREVAVKVLPSAFASDPERIKRFEREARSAPSLNPRVSGPGAVDRGAVHLQGAPVLPTSSPSWCWAAR